MSLLGWVWWPEPGKRPAGVKEEVRIQESWRNTHLSSVLTQCFRMAAELLGNVHVYRLVIPTMTGNGVISFVQNEGLVLDECSVEMAWKEEGRLVCLIPWCRLLTLSWLLEQGWKDIVECRPKWKSLLRTVFGVFGGSPDGQSDSFCKASLS